MITSIRIGPLVWKRRPGDKRQRIVTSKGKIVVRRPKRFVITSNDWNLGELVTAVENLPLSQWPTNACPPWRPDCCDEDLSVRAK